MYKITKFRIETETKENFVSIETGEMRKRMRIVTFKLFKQNVDMDKGIYLVVCN